MQTELINLTVKGKEEQVLYMLTEDGYITYISPSGVSHFNLPLAQIVGKKEADLFDTQVSFDLMEIDQRVLITGRPHHYQIKQTVAGIVETLSFTKHLIPAPEKKAPQLACTLHVMKTEPQEKQQPVVPLNQQFLALQAATTAVNNSLNLDHITTAFVWEMAQLLQSSACAYYLWQDKQKQFLLQTSYDETKNIPFEELLAIDTHPFLRHCLEDQTVYQFNQKSATQRIHENIYLRRLNINTLFLIPVISQGRLLGLAIVCMKELNRVYAESETAVASLLTDQTASTIFNAQLYTELLHTNERLIESNGDLQAFARTTAHDLKNPVGSIIGFADLLVQQHNTFSQEEIKEFLDIILRSSRQMHAIIDNLLLLASVRQQDIPATPVAMEIVLPEVLTRLAYLIKQNNCEVIIPKEWPIGFGNAHWLQEVWANYISNAIKYGGKPPIVELGATNQNNGMIRFWVKDNGVGLSPEEQEKLFIPFSRLHSKGSTQGHGLGLSIVQRIIHKLNGSVGVESTLGEGSQFYFTLPAHSFDK